MTLAATYFGANGWLLELDQMRVLVDPWLKGALSFPPGPWLLKGELSEELDAPEDLDLLLLTQGLADHAHPESLKMLPRTLPVVGSTAAIQVVKSLGFTTMTALKPGEATTVQQLTIQATAGAMVPAVENGYLLNHPGGSLYLEPHGFLDPSLPPQQLDAVITPMVDLGLPLTGPFVKGCSVVEKLVERFQPTTVLASTSGGDVRFKGILSGMLQMKGSVRSTAAGLPDGTRWIDSVAGERYCLKPGR
jgi:L-ascorbate metabolism protein UlaG (beta-lactamase superfamily)